MILLESPPLAGAALESRHHSAWTVERVLDLKRLWVIEGMSAAQVAYELGGFEHCVDGGRSAVIGKVHRLNLETRTRMPRTLDLADTRKRARTKSRLTAAHLHKRKAEAKELRAVEVAPEAEPPVFSAAPCSLLELTTENCHWPIGDPREPDFHFCGGKAVGDMPYCGPHCRVAYQPPAARRDRIPARA